LQSSGSGGRALHPSQPRAASQVSTPQQTPFSFSAEQARIWPSVSAVQSQIPDTGTHMSAWRSPAALKLGRHSNDSGQGSCAEQGRPQERASASKSAPASAAALRATTRQNPSPHSESPTHGWHRWLLGG